MQAASLRVAARRSRASTTADAAAPLLTDADEQVRGEAALTLGTTLRVGKTGVQPAALASSLTVLATDPSVDVRKKAAWALGEIGAPVTQAAPALRDRGELRPQPGRALARARGAQQAHALAGAGETIAGTAALTGRTSGAEAGARGVNIATR